MPQAQLLLEAQTLLERPTCEHCGNRMWLTHMVPDIENHERRTFECPVCKQAEAKIVKLR